MLASGAARLLSGFILSTSGLVAPTSRAASGAVAVLRAFGAWTQPLHITALGAGPATALAGYSTRTSDSAGNPIIQDVGGSATVKDSCSHSYSHGSGALDSLTTAPTAAPPGESSPAAAVTAAGAPFAATPDDATPDDASPASSSSVSVSVSSSRTAPVSRRDKSAASDVVYPSSRDDSLGVQRNWFNALFTQLSVIQRTGMAPHLKGRQKEVFEAVEREFEALWERYVQNRGLQGTAHRGMLMCCLAIATHKVLLYETGDDTLVREVVRTNLGGTAVGIMMRLHKIRLWLLLRLLAEDPYKQAVRFLPSLQGDLGSLVAGEVAEGQGEGGEEATWAARRCGFHSVLAAEGATELLPEFCCQFGMQWLEVFSQYGVRVGLEESLGFGDERCVVRISRPGGRDGAPDAPLGRS